MKSSKTVKFIVLKIFPLYGIAVYKVLLTTYITYREIQDISDE